MVSWNTSLPALHGATTFLIAFNPLTNQVFADAFGPGADKLAELIRSKGLHCTALSVATREIERLENMVEGRKGGVVGADAARQAAETRLSTLLPAQRATAIATLKQAQVELDKTVVYAGVSGRVELGFGPAERGQAAPGQEELGREAVTNGQKRRCRGSERRCGR